MDPRPGDVMYTKADVSKFNKHGWASQVDLEIGLNSVYQRLKDELE